VLETARGGIVRAGLGYDLADVGVITNIAEDHLGQDGIETLEELVHVKSLVVEAVRENGYAVLNAMDAMTGLILDQIRVPVILFAAQWDGRARAYEDRVSRFVYCREDTLCLRDGSQETFLVPIADIPITVGGTIACNVENCLAAAAALWALRMPPDAIAAGLRSFTENPGRFNRYELGNMTVMVDYGHNQAGYQAAIQSLEAAGAKRRIGVIGMPGDRKDSDILQVGRLCAGFFEKLYIKEDKDLRGRQKGEVAALLQKAADGICPPECIVIKENELEALREAVETGEDGDIIAVFYEELDPIHQYLSSRRAAVGRI